MSYDLIIFEINWKTEFWLALSEFIRYYWIQSFYYLSSSSVDLKKIRVLRKKCLIQFSVLNIYKYFINKLMKFNLNKNH